MAKARTGSAELERRRSLVGRWRRSGRSAADFAERVGVSPWTLYSWAKRMVPRPDGVGEEKRRPIPRAKPRRDLELIPVHLVEAVRPTESGRAPLASDGVVEVQVRSGDVVRILGDVSEERLRAVLAAVRQSC